MAEDKSEDEARELTKRLCVLREALAALVVLLSDSGAQGRARAEGRLARVAGVAWDATAVDPGLESTIMDIKGKREAILRALSTEQT